jgi:hypothetical protein
MSKFIELDHGGAVAVDSIVAVTCSLDRGIGTSHTHEDWIVRVHLSSGACLDVAKCEAPRGINNAVASRQAYNQAVHWASSIRSMMLDARMDRKMMQYGVLVNLCGEDVADAERHLAVVEDDGWPGDD